MKFNQTFSVASPLLALGNFYFNGTGIWLAGNPGEPSSLSYTIILDNSTYTYLEYTASGALFGHGDLSPTVQHRLSFHPPEIVSSATIEWDVNANTQVDIDDSDLWNSPPQGVAFASHGDWASNSCIGSGQYEGTCHTSSTAGDWMSLTFEGDAISVYGALNGPESRYTVTVDGGAPTEYIGVVASTDSSVALAFANNLGPGAHVLTIANSGVDGAGKLEIDSVLLWNNIAPEGASTSSDMSRSAKIGLIVGTVLACVFIALGWMAYLLYCEKTGAVKVAAAKILDSDVWSFNWTKKEAERDSVSDDESFTDEKRPAPISPVSPPPGIAQPRPAHSKTTSFDAPWLEASPRQPSFHPFSEDVEAPPTNNKFAFLNRWGGH